MASAITSTGKIPGSKSNDDIDSVKHVDLDGMFFLFNNFNLKLLNETNKNSKKL